MANQKQQEAKLICFPKTRKLNLATLVLIAIMVYVLIFAISGTFKKHIVGYEVKEGSLFVSGTYNGLILRDETIVTTNDNGYVNYYAREGERVSVGDLVYTIDGTGKLNEMLAKGSSQESKLSDEDLNEIRNDIIHFSKDFDKNNFQTVYNFKYNLQGTALKLANLNILNSIDTLSQGNMLSGVKMIKAPQSGYVVYNKDGYENLTVSSLTKDHFNTEKYEKQQFVNNQLINEGDFVYKTINNENWSVIIKIDTPLLNELEQGDYVQVKFLKTQTKSWAQIEYLQIEEEYYCVLKFNNSVSTFCNERFLDIEIISSQEVGLKIPKSSIVEKEFYLIPESYAFETGNSSDEVVFVRESYMEDGTLSSERMNLTIYAQKDGFYYVDKLGLSPGDYFIDYLGNKYGIGKIATLVGVYYMNKGYADFRQIISIYENDEYAIVKSNSTYGLRAYDYIVLDAESVDEDDLLYE